MSPLPKVFSKERSHALVFKCPIPQVHTEHMGMIPFWEEAQHGRVGSVGPQDHLWLEQYLSGIV